MDISIDISLGGAALILTILFVTLKALGYLNWTWLWVFSPLWIAASIISIILLILLADWLSGFNFFN